MTLIGDEGMAGSVFRRGIIRAFSAQLDYSNGQIATHEQDPQRADLERARGALESQGPFTVVPSAPA